MTNDEFEEVCMVTRHRVARDALVRVAGKADEIAVVIRLARAGVGMSSGVGARR